MTVLPFGLLLTVVADVFGVRSDDICGPCRKRHNVWPRQAAMLLAGEYLVYSGARIGARLGGRDHTTVLHGQAAAKKRISEDREFAELYRHAETILQERLFESRGGMFATSRPIVFLRHSGISGRQAAVGGA
jgi:chromosomal replication initiator protein